MDYDYVISLKRPNYTAINLISQLLLLIYLIAFVRTVLEMGFQDLKVQSLMPIAIIALWIYIKVQSKKADFVANYRLALFMAGLGWGFVNTDYALAFAIAYFILGAAERLIKFPDEIGFSKENVVRNTLPKKRYEWVEIENAIIRDNLFTLDLRNNKIIQKELDEPITKELEQEFNEFCKAQMLFSLQEDKH